MRESKRRAPRRRPKRTAADVARCVLVTAASVPVAWLGASLLSHRTLPSHERIGTIVFTVLLLGNAVRYSIRSWTWSGIFLSVLLLFPAALDRRCLLLASLAIPILTAAALYRWGPRHRFGVAAVTLGAGALAVLGASVRLAPWPGSVNKLVRNAWDVQWSMRGEQEQLSRSRGDWERAIGAANLKELDERAKREFEQTTATAQAAAEKEHGDYLQDAITLYRRASGQLNQARVSALLAKARANDSKEKGRAALAALDELLRLEPNHAEAIKLRRKVCEYYPLTVDLGGGVTMKFVPIPAGEFLMGSPADEAGREAGETLHKVKLTRPFFMQTTPVTQAQWQAVMGNNPSGFHGDNLPVENVSWKDAVAFCQQLSQKDGKHYRLPTEAEWEYACRGGTRTIFGGGGNLDDIAWYARNSNHQTHPVAQKKPNAWNLYDMHGNVWQWCSDGYGDYARDAVDPTGSDDGVWRVLRGGSWFNDPIFCRAAFRNRHAPDNRFTDVGFRICRDF